MDANTQAATDTPEYFGQAYAAFNAAAIKSVNGRVLNIKSALMAFHDAALEAALAAREGADTARLDWLACAENAIEIGISGVSIGASPTDLRQRIDAARTTEASSHE